MHLQKSYVHDDEQKDSRRYVQRLVTATVGVSTSFGTTMPRNVEVVVASDPRVGADSGGY
jgi:hypothetical protein